MSASPAKRDAITERYQGIVRPIAERLKAHLPFSIELEDLIQIGLLTLWEVAGSFNPRRAATFGYYVRLRIRGAMIDSIKGRAYRDSTHQELPVIPITDSRQNVEESLISREEALMVARSRRAEAQRVRGAIDDQDPKFHPLSSRQKKILALRYGDGLTQKDAGKVLKITQAGARELEQRALRNLKRKLAA